MLTVAISLSSLKTADLEHFIRALGREHFFGVAARREAVTQAQVGVLGVHEWP